MGQKSFADLNAAIDRLAVSAANYKTEKQALIDKLVTALEEARDALNGAPNTVGLHNQINDALSAARGEKK